VTASYTPLQTSPSEEVHLAATLTSECLPLVDSCSVPSVNTDGGVNDTSSTAYCRCRISPKDIIIPSGYEQSSGEDDHGTAAPASQPDSVATGRDSSSPYQSTAWQLLLPSGC